MAPQPARSLFPRVFNSEFSDFNNIKCYIMSRRAATVAQQVLSDGSGCSCCVRELGCLLCRTFPNLPFFHGSSFQVLPFSASLLSVSLTAACHASACVDRCRQCSRAPVNVHAVSAAKGAMPRSAGLRCLLCVAPPVRQFSYFSSFQWSRMRRRAVTVAACAHGWQ